MEFSTETQNIQVLKHFKQGGTLTALEAVHRFGITRLSARVYDLKNMGYRVIDSWEVNDSTGKRFKRYGLGAEH
jgi:hypothetical protein